MDVSATSKNVNNLWGAVTMTVKLARSRTVMRILLAASLLVVVSIHLGCEKKQPAAEPQQEVSSQPAASQEATAEPGAAAASKIPLKILYVGLPDTERQKDFVDFLGKHFEHVETADYYNFQEAASEDCDVAIFDKDGIEWKPMNINVSSQYSRATVTIGVPGAFWGSRRNLKTGYM